MNRVLQMIEQFGKPRTSRTGPLTMPAGQPCMLSFDFVEEQPEIESAELISENFSGSLGRTAECISSRSLIDPHCLEEVTSHKETRITSLHQAISHGSTSDEIDPARRRKPRKARPVAKVQASALLEASELISIPGKYRSREHLEPALVSAAGKQVSLDILRKLGERSSQDELLEKVKVACEKVQADALYGPSLRREVTLPQRHKIRIKIG
ncbi:hypothetical protein COW36_02560 [bacterium (Candidatus Blackallbacteria) CG17_big_fil_post_rev_8_21_14_2_50_48_46]|uniref:Uncharacterized protein n=1 Tax=bacterium (Candidatus Blackallbacteria) CG17_big_fil_post_rev_8_21_14_2_50_48_46 TaxID=2014261 RepID=A0A2M7GA36_9BACT|nr:MAG: hypothetical protein COW64_12910 [bacterium (Candidatus Blackallbacteria) CG18_big_fil_WC_8_21_14_2_50_49_26]PIW19010.1 MAG: hypothetical protein COW36_02560 [bacterium (Candidatus Blackallbacteria) CG17_big_fil_post_rev_8_21_14_2_50_48_46]PIW44622.1 MAG: hypothetical protein COW20_23555 [bacterium (Candidatus Blackallbacteria) CG13_big_fil_rev_8_21_14_2_50_49_14]